MVKNYLILAFRNLKRSKGFSFINIVGLAIGIACFITLTLFVLDESGYDAYNKNAAQIYRVIVHSNFNGNESTTSKSSAPCGPTLLRDFPEVEKVARIGYFGQHHLRVQDKVFRENAIYAVDSTYFDLFTLPFIYGNPGTALKQPNAIVISETASKKYFGNENPVGKTFIVDGHNTYLITGVMKDFPRKSHLRCNFLLSLTTYPESHSQNWFDLFYTTYVQLKKGTSPHEFENKMVKTIQDHVGPQAEAVLGFSYKEFYSMGNSYEFLLQPLTSIYLRSKSDFGIDANTEWGDTQVSDITYSYIFLAVGGFILLIAVFNFMNLATARSEKRAKEVGIRKTLGSDKYTLIHQFLTESILTCLISTILAIILLLIVLPLFNRFFGRELELGLFANPYTIPILIVFTVIVGMLAGSYPAFYLSSFQPAHILKTKTGRTGKQRTCRSVLVILQFAISIALIIGTIIVKNQLHFIQNKNLGFKREHLIIINNAAVLGNRVEVYKQEISKNPNVVSATVSSLMFESGIPGNGYFFDRVTGPDVVTCQYLDVDDDFVETYQIQMKSGRFFSDQFSTDSASVVINEAAVKACRTTDPLGKKLAQINGVSKEMQSYKIIGVVEDFNYESLHQTIRPLVFHLGRVRQASTILTIRVLSGELRQTMRFLEETWRPFAGNDRFNCTFLDQNLNRMYETEMKIGVLTMVFSFLAIFIACLGLVGLAAFVTEQRIKEIGIRKVLGASVTEIVTLLSREFTKMVVLANILAWPVAYYVMKSWLQNFAYRINIDWGIFILSGIIALAVALATVSTQALKAALANPIKSLRYE